MIDRDNQTILHLKDNNIAAQLVAIMETLPKELSLLLDEAQLRYMHLIGITSGFFDAATVAADRIKYAGYYEISKGKNLPHFNDDDCINFMSDLYDLPKLLCRIQITNDFNWTAASGFTDDAEIDIQTSCNSMIERLRDDTATAETIEYLLRKGIEAELFGK